MTNTVKIWLLVAATLVVGIAGGYYAHRPAATPEAVQGASLGLGHIEAVKWIFARGANFGTGEQTNIDNAGNISSTANVTTTGALVAGQVTFGGTAEAQTAVATGTLAVSSVCNDSFLSITPVSTTPTITFPATTTLFATCLGTIGQYRDIVVKAITTSTIFAAGAGGTIINTSALTIAAGKGAVLRFIHDSSSLSGTYIVALINLLN